jgi:hypothetical protein
VEATTEVSAQNVLYCALSRARNIIEELHQVITVKLVRRGDGSGRARRRAWLRNKQKIVRLRDNLKDAREALLGALSADLLSELPSSSWFRIWRLMRHSRSSTRRVESTLTIIGQQSTSNHSTALSIDQRLENIENALDPRQSAQATKLALPTISNSSRVHPESREAAPCMLRSSMGTFGHFLESSSFHDTDTAIIPEKNTCALWLPQIQAQSLDNPLVQRAVPASPFEMSASFQPETYTVLDAAPTLFSYSNREMDATEYTRVNQCAMFYSKAPRQWTRLTVSITTSVESKYWNLERVKSANLVPKATYALPISLASVLETFVRSCQNLKQDSHLSMFLGNRSDLEKNEKASKLPVKFIKPPFRVQAYLQEITSMVYHSNCPRYSERELIQRPLYRYRPNNFFIAYLQSRWVFEFRFGSDKPQIDSHLYILQVLHCLRGAPGINPFIGVVLDEDSGIINAFLCELPARGNLFHIMTNANKSGQPVTWERRWKWCRQIVQGVAEMHSKGFVVGSLGEAISCPVAIDADDNAVLYNRFQKTFAYENIQAGVLPPEHRQSASIRGSITALPHTDIYQLGLLLWRIAANKSSRLRSGFCKIAGCTTKAGTVCTEPHADPVQLPSPGEHTPEYLREVIAACRAESADERPPAWKLLEMFPPMAEDNANLTKAVDDGGIIHPSDHQDISIEGGTAKDHASQQMSTRPGPPAECTPNHFTRLEEFLERYNREVNCDICGERTSQHYFRCRICATANYDFCPRCFFQGAHCLECDHYLREYSEGNKEERYYTNVKETGQRDVITL